MLGTRILMLVVLYPLAKRITWWPQVMLGLVFGWGAPMGYAAAPAGWIRRRGCSTPRRSAGSSATTRSMRIRTARTTR